MTRTPASSRGDPARPAPDRPAPPERTSRRPPAPRPTGSGRPVPAVERAVALLDALAAAQRPQSLTALARGLALPKSSLHGLLTTLASAGLVRRSEAGEYSLGPKPLQWADAFASQSDVLRAFHAHADRFAALRAETVMLASLDGNDVLYLGCRQGSRPLAVNFRVGGRFPAECTSSGKAMLATLADVRVRERYGDAPLRRLTRHATGSLAALLRQLAEVRERGHAVDDEETAEGMQCFGAPVFALHRGDAVAAVAVSVIKAGLAPRNRARLAAAIRGLAAAVSADLGAPPPARGAQ